MEKGRQLPPPPPPLAFCFLLIYTRKQVLFMPALCVKLKTGSQVQTGPAADCRLVRK